MRRRDGGAGRRRGRRTGPQSGSRRPAIPGLALGRRPRTRLATSYSGGVGAPPGGTTASRQELADCDAHRVAESAARRRKENAAAGRRKARRPPSLAGDLGRSRDRADREAAHRVRRSAPAPVGALLPSFFREERKKTKGIRRPTQTGGGALASLRHSGRAKRGPESITTGWDNETQTEQYGEVRGYGFQARAEPVIGPRVCADPLAPSRNDREAEETGQCRSPTLAPLPPLVDSHAADAGGRFAALVKRQSWGA